MLSMHPGTDRPRGSGRGRGAGRCGGHWCQCCAADRGRHSKRCAWLVLLVLLVLGWLHNGSFMTMYACAALACTASCRTNTETAHLAMSHALVQSQRHSGNSSCRATSVAWRSRLVSTRRARGRATPWQDFWRAPLLRQSICRVRAPDVHKPAGQSWLLQTAAKTWALHCLPTHRRAQAG